VDRDFPGFVEQDGDLMKAAGINAVRTYDPITDLDVLDKLWERGIWVVMQMYPWGGFDPRVNPEMISDTVHKVKDHPAIIMWEVGNEWNYNNLYQIDKGMSFEEARDRVKAAIDVIKANDTTHKRPVATNLGEIGIFEDPNADLFNKLSNADIFSMNTYREANFGDIFAKWKTLTTKPLYMGEFGCDAWDSRPEHSTANLTAQADCTRWLQELIVENSTIYGGALHGGFLFEFADEWWKDKSDKSRGLKWHDVGGSAPGFGPYPDRDFNEEWWGIVDIWRSPRPAYFEYAKIPIPVAGYCPSTTGSSTAACAQATPPEAPVVVSQEAASQTASQDKFMATTL